MPYLLDSSPLIEAKNFYYKFAVCPGFWDWLVNANKDGLVFSLEAVKSELLVQNDELSQWASKLGGEFFLPVNEPTIAEIRKISTWINGHKVFTAANKAEFLAKADFQLVAYALGNNFTVVTRETGNYDPRMKRVKIPVVCKEFGVKCKTLFEMLEEEKAQFINGA